MQKRVMLACAIVLALPAIQPRRSSSRASEVPVMASKMKQGVHAEALLWEVWVSDERTVSFVQTVMKHYLRIAVFDERGAEMVSKVDIPNFENRRVTDVWAKTTRKNGEVVELKKDGIFERVIAKAGGVKIRTTSFVLPGLEPGAIVEYGWRERHYDELANYVRLPLQREYPVQTVRYHIKPLDKPYYAMRVQTFKTQQPPFEKERDGFVGMTFTNIPALEEEPDMPPDNEVSRWMLIFYALNTNLTPDKYWHDLGKSAFDDLKPRMKVNDDIKRKATQLVESAATDEEKLKRLFVFCRSSVKNIRDPAAGLTIEQRTEFKENKTPADTLKRGMGTGSDIDLLFAALANAAGFEAHYAYTADRSQYFFHKEYANAYFMGAHQIAVRVNEKWRFFDPASTYVPFAMLRWQEEGNDTLVTDSKEPEMVKTEISPAEKSERRRLGGFELSEDGTLEGDVRITHSGHRVVERRREYSALKEEERLEDLKKEIEEQFPGAEVTRLELHNLANPDLPLAWNYHVKIPAYAQRTGKRLFLQPEVFQRGQPARFTAATRKFPIYFHYPWMDVDHVTIKIPASYELDHADRPPSVPLGETGDYKVSAQFDSRSRELIYKRELVFGKNFALLYSADAYAAIKQFFEFVRAGDNHVVTLKQGAGTQ